MSIRIRTLGGFQVEAPGRDLASLLDSRLRSALLAYLAVERDVPRDLVRELFWPGRNPNDADRLLERHLAEIERAIGDGSITTTPGRIRVSPDVESDIAAFDAAVRTGAWAAAIDLHDGPFLDHFPVQRGRPFEIWLSARRLRIESDLEQARAAIVHTPTSERAQVPERTSVATNAEASATVYAQPVSETQPWVRLLTELKRRQVFRVAWGFCLAAFVVIQLASATLAVYFPTAYTVVLLIIIFIFPVALLLAWVFELTPEGHLRWEQSGNPVTARWAGTRRGRSVIAIAGTLVIGSTAWLTVTRWAPLFPRLFGATSDASTYVVLPFDADTATIPFDGAQNLRDALLAWQGIDVLALDDVAEQLDGRTDRSPGRRMGRTAAAKLGAGRYVLGSIHRTGGMYRVRAALYSLDSTAAVSEAFVDVPSTDGASADSAFASLANRLLFGETDSPELIWPGTRSIDARIKYEAARARLTLWDAAGADSLLMQAIVYDPDYARAHLELAQLRMWSGQPGRLWAASGQRATGATLSPREQLLAAAMVHMAGQRFPQACALYAQLVERDPRDVAALFGVVECNRRDQVVVRDAASPTGWSFRASYQTAIDAYVAAFQLEPDALRMFRANSFDRIRHFLYTANTRLRDGFPENPVPEIRIFRAISEIAGDTIAFVPVPQASESATQLEFSNAHARAVQKQRQIFRDLARRWARESRSAAALEALAIGMDLVGDPGALDTLTLARSLSNAAFADQLVATEVWLRVKLNAGRDHEQLARAARLADSITAAEQPLLASSLAALTGHAHRAARALEQLEIRDMSPAVSALRNRLLAYSSLGAPKDSIVSIGERALETIRNVVPADEQKAARDAVFGLPAGLAFITAPDAVARWARPSGDYLIDAQFALRAGRADLVRAHLATAQDTRRQILPVDLRFDTLLPEAELLFELGDLPAAAAWLDPTLNALPFAGPQAFLDVPNAAALVRAMALRAEIAHTLRDRPTAERWARSVVALWSRSDAELRPVVDRMKNIAGDVSPAEQPGR